MVVCHCTAVNDERIRSVLAAGATDIDDLVADIGARCGAGSRCGGCLDTIRSLVAHHLARPVDVAIGRSGSLASA